VRGDTFQQRLHHHLRPVAVNRADGRVAVVAQQRERELYGKAFPVLVTGYHLQFQFTMLFQRRHYLSKQLLLILGRVESGNGLSEHFLWCIAEDAGRFTVPTNDGALHISHHDRAAHLVEDLRLLVEFCCSFCHLLPQLLVLCFQHSELCLYRFIFHSRSPA